MRSGLSWSDGALSYAGTTLSLSNVHSPSIAVRAEVERGVEFLFSGPVIVASAGAPLALAAAEAVSTEPMALAMELANDDFTPAMPAQEFALSGFAILRPTTFSPSPSYASFSA